MRLDMRKQGRQPDSARTCLISWGAVATPNNAKDIQPALIIHHGEDDATWLVKCTN